MTVWVWVALGAVVVVVVVLAAVARSTRRAAPGPEPGTGEPEVSQRARQMLEAMQDRVSGGAPISSRASTSGVSSDHRPE